MMFIDKLLQKYGPFDAVLSAIRVKRNLSMVMSQHLPYQSH